MLIRNPYKVRKHCNPWCEIGVVRLEGIGKTVAMAMVTGSLLIMFSASAHSEINASYTYDAMGRLVSAVYTDGTKSTTVTYSYDASGNRTSVIAK